MSSSARAGSTRRPRWPSAAGNVADVSDPAYWDDQYRTGAPPAWDLGAPAPGLLGWLAEHPKLSGRALVPGCGAGHDAVAIAKSGLSVTAADFAPNALEATGERAAAAGLRVEAVPVDVLSPPAAWTNAFDWVFEHTCYCAIAPWRRDAYAQAMAKVLKPGGRLVGVFFTHGEPGGPPFNTTVEELRTRFATWFELEELEPLTSSVGRRANQEHLAVYRRKP